VIKKKDKAKAKETMVVRDHVRELQWRLLAVFALLVTAGVVSFFFYHQILDILRAPLGQELYYTTPVGSFAFIMRICLIGGMVVAIPAIIYNLLMFVRPAFKRPMGRGMIFLITLFSLGLAATGVLFSYFVIIPGALRFFGGFSVDGLSALIQADSYLNFVINALIIFMLMFQLPLIITLTDHMKRLSMKKLFRAERWVILGSLIAALMVPFAMDLSVSLLISLPIILLYNLSIAIVAVRHWLSRKPKPVKESPTPGIRIPEPLVSQPATSPVQAKKEIPSIAAPTVQPTPPKPRISHEKPTSIKKPTARLMDIQSYPINHSEVAKKSESTAKEIQAIETIQPAAPVAPLTKFEPVLRTETRSAPRLTVPERVVPAMRVDFGRVNELDPEII